MPDSAPALSPTAYLVLGLIQAAGEATPYDLKRMASSVSGLWTLRHDQVYRETERLARSGLLSEDREQHGRRRRRFRITRDGRRALQEWLQNPTVEFTELRDPGLLQLFLGADPVALARAQLPIHQQKLAEYQQLIADCPPDAPPGVVLSLESGIGHEREWVRFWTRLAGDSAA